MENELEYIALMNLQVPFEQKDLKSAYRKLCRLYHPDLKAKESDDVKKILEEQMKKVNEAYSYLNEHFSSLISNKASYSGLYKEEKKKREDQQKNDEKYKQRKAYEQKLEESCKKINLSLITASDLYHKVVANKSFDGPFIDWINSRITIFSELKESNEYKYIKTFYSKIETSKFFDLDFTLNLFITEKELLKQNIDIYSFLIKLDSDLVNLSIAAKENADVGKIYDLKNDPEKFRIGLKMEMEDAVNIFYLSDELTSIFDVIAKEIKFFKLSSIIEQNLQYLRQHYDTTMMEESFEEFLLKNVEIKQLCNILKTDKIKVFNVYKQYVNSTDFEGSLDEFRKDIEALLKIKSSENEYKLPNDLDVFMGELIRRKNAFNNSSEYEKQLGFTGWLNQENLLFKFGCNNYRELLAMLQNNLGNISIEDLIDSFINEQTSEVTIKK